MRMMSKEEGYIYIQEREINYERDRERRGRGDIKKREGSERGD